MLTIDWVPAWRKSTSSRPSAFQGLDGFVLLTAPRVRHLLHSEKRVKPRSTF